MRHLMHAVARTDTGTGTGTGTALAPTLRTLCVGHASAPRSLVALRGLTLGLLAGLASTHAATVAVAAVTAAAQYDLRAAPGAQVQAGVLFHAHPGTAEVLDGRVPARHTEVAPPSSHGVGRATVLKLAGTQTVAAPTFFGFDRVVPRPAIRTGLAPSRPSESPNLDRRAGPAALQGGRAGANPASGKHRNPCAHHPDYKTATSPANRGGSWPAFTPVGVLLYARQGRRERKAASPHDSVFHGAIADTAPDAWGRRVIAREHAKRRKDDPALPALTELDHLLAVDDFSRVGALRLRGADGRKFPSIADSRSVTRGEVLALQLASHAGIAAAPARVVRLGEVPVAVIRRFDRDDAGGRIPYQSAASLLQASREEDRSYTEIVDAIRTHGHAPTQDAQQLWRRLLFNLLITNVDDHLQNHGFLHVERGLWRLAPALDINPFSDKDRESKTWLSEQDGPITDVRMLLARAGYFAIDTDHALHTLAEVHAAVSTWRQLALSAQVGLRQAELDDFAPAFEHTQMEQAAALLRR